MAIELTKSKTAVLIGISGSNNAFSLSLYNLKAYAFSDENIKRNWNIPVIQHPLINEGINKKIAEKKIATLAEKIIAYQAEVVGFACYMWNVKAFKKLAVLLRQSNPELKIVWGGPEMTTDYIINGKYDNYEIDFCVSGEGELTFLELLRHLTFSNPTIEQINGLSFKKNNSFHVNEKRQAFTSLSQIPSPYLQHIVDDEVLTRENIEANLETQRGCSLRCSYCIYHKDMNKISYNAVERVIQEVKWVCSYGVKYIRFVDANFSSDLEHAKNIMRSLIAERIESKLMFELIPGFIDEELAALFHNYNQLYDWNNITLGIGVQTINHEVLKKLRRGIRIDKFEKTFHLAEKYHIYIKIDLIIGLPGEDIHSIERTLEYFLDRLRNSHAHLLCCHLMRGLPGTELLTIAKQHGMIFSSEREPHELVESPLLPRHDLLKCLRRTAVIFRLVNHSGWASQEFIWKTEASATSIRDCFYEAKERLQITNITLIDILIDKLMPYLQTMQSNFSEPDFPYAESWWWTWSKAEISNEWLVKTLKSIK